MRLLRGNYYPLFYLRSTSTNVILYGTQRGFIYILYDATDGFTMDLVVKVPLVVLRVGRVNTLTYENFIGLWRIV